jgi:hypothetical protein
MLTDRERKLVDWLKKRRLATMKHLRHQFQVSHMTVVRALKKYGYFTSYNSNAAYYTLHDVPQFDSWGLWAYREIRFSKFGTLPQTVVALVQNAPAGMTTAELEDRLQTQVANLLCRLVQQGRLTRRSLLRRQVVYLAADLEQADGQYQQRQQLSVPAAHPPEELPPNLAADQVIAILRQMVLAPEASPQALARQLARRAVAVTAGEVRRVREHYGLEKKRRRWP